jgi:hypothetical protein
MNKLNEEKQEFENILKRTAQFLIITKGLIASGKTTWRRELGLQCYQVNYGDF